MWHVVKAQTLTKSTNNNTLNAVAHIYHLTLDGGRNWQWGKPSMMIGYQGMGQHIDPDKCEVSWSPLTNHQMARNLLQTHSIAPTHTKFTEVKSSFFILQLNSGPCLFNFIWCSWKACLSSKCYKLVLYNKRGRHFLVFVDWEEILKHCAMVPQKFWKVERAFYQQSIWESVLDKRYPCSIHTEWRAISFSL